MQSETTAGMEAGNVHSCSNCDRPLDPPQAESAENVSPNIESGTVNITEKPATRAKHREGLSPKSQAIPEAPTTSPFSTGARKRTGKINNPPPSSPGSFSQHFETTIRLNEILSGETELNHPICQDCSDTLIDSVDERLKEVEIEVKDYQRYLTDLSDRDEEGEESIEELRAELARLEANEEKLISHCRALERERDTVFRKRDRMLAKEELLLKAEKEETKEYLGVKYNWMKANEELLSIGNRYKYAEHRLRTLNGTNAFKEMFQIDCDGSIGKINGFRLGKLTAVPVKWKEINIAWGETVFLMDFLCRMFDFESEEFVLVPYGDKSHVEIIRKKSVTWPLYLHTEGDSEKMPMYDSAQMAFLKCLSQLEQAIKRRYKDFALIHPISNCKIHGNDSERPHSITLSINTHEGWTKALKCMLVDLRQILTFYIDRVKGGE